MHGPMNVKAEISLRELSVTQTYHTFIPLTKSLYFL